MTSVGLCPKRVATVGMFDGVHLGHQLVVAQLRQIAMARSLVATVFSFDVHPMTVVAPERTPRLLSTLAQRAEGLVQAGADEVIFLPFADIRSLSAYEFLRLLKERYGVEVLVVGFNHHFGRGGKGTFGDYCLMGAEIGIEVVKADEYVCEERTSEHEGFEERSRRNRGEIEEKSLRGEIEEEIEEKFFSVSSSSIRHALSLGNVNLANQLLGHPYAVAGIVTHGRNIGHSLGFPTANLQPFLVNLQLPAYGVYASEAVTSFGRVPAMVNIGTNPTVAADSPVSIEAHLIDYTGDLYGTVMTIEFIARLRDEQKFDSLEALSSQLMIDKACAQRMLDR